MARRAVWRRTADEPRSWLGYAFADRDRQLRPTRNGLGCLGKVGAIFLFATGHPVEAMAAFGLALLPLLRVRRRSVDPLLTLPLPAAAYACEVDVTREGAAIGIDRGVVTFLDGWLHFEGYRTTFSLSRADVERRKDNDHLDLRPGGGLDFRADRKVQDEFATALDRWYRIDPAAQGVSLLPPIRLHRSGTVRAQADLAYQGMKVVLGALALFVAFRFFDFPIWVVVFFGAGGLVDAVLAFQRVRRFAVEERTLANETRRAVGR